MNIRIILPLFTAIIGICIPAFAADELNTASPSSVINDVNAASVSAQNEKIKKQETSVAKEVVVTATRTERKINEVPARVIVITKEDIAKMHVEKTEEILKNVTGVDLSVSAGAFPAGINMRGLPGTFAGNTVLVLVDSVPVEPVTLITRRLAWNIVKPQDIERIEILFGPASALYGSNAAGGVINIITKKGEGKGSAQITAGYGSHNAYTTAATVSHSSDKLDIRISADRYKTDGYIAIPTLDQFGQIDLAGRGYTNETLNTSARYWLSDNQSISAGFSHFGRDGVWFGGHPNNTYKVFGDIVSLSYQNKVNDGLNIVSSFLASSYATKNTWDFAFLNGYVPGNPNNDNIVTYSNEYENGIQGDIHADLALLKNNTLTTGISYSPGGEWNLIRTDASGSATSSSTSSATNLGIYLQDEHRFGDQVIVNLGGRYDSFNYFNDTRNGVVYNNSNDSVFNPHAGIRYNPTSNTSWYITGGSAYLPAPNTLKYRSGGIWLDNPNLKPEKSISYEIGVDQKFTENLKGTLSIYTTKYADKIDMMIIGANRQYQNVGEVSVNGGEAGIEGSFGAWHPFVNYTLSDSVISQNPTNPALVGKKLTNLPSDKFNVGFVYDDPTLFVVRVAGKYVGSQFTNTQNTTINPSYFAVDAKISKEFSFGDYLMEFSLAGNNIFNARYIAFATDWADAANYWAEINLKF